MKIFILLLCLLGLAPAPPSPFQDECRVGEDLYSSATPAPTIQIDMSLEPYFRWQQVAKQYEAPIKALIQLVFDRLGVILPNIENFMNVEMSTWITLMPQPYRDEIQGIADALNVPVGQMVFFNLFYEIHSMCTSIVAVDPTGRVIKGRNMDFGMWFGFHPINGTYQWVLQQKLLPVSVKTEYMMGNQSTGIHSLSFVGYVGIFEGYREGAFSISMNTRYYKLPPYLDSGFWNVAAWLIGLKPGATFDTFAIRDTLFKYDNYQDAKVSMITTQILAPCYYILAGVNDYEGAIVARGPNNVEDLVELKRNTDPKWYVLQTNYDPNKPVLYLDDRRTAGRNCMNKLGQTNVTIPNLYTVLSSKSTLNKQTIVSVMTDVKNGIFEIYLQNCPDPCWFT